MTITGGEIHELIKETAEWADKIGDTLSRADKIREMGSSINVSMNYEALKRLEHILIMCEDIIKNAKFNFAPPEEN